MVWFPETPLLTIWDGVIGTPTSSDLTPLASGGFLVAWHDPVAGVQARTISADGTLGAVIQIDVPFGAITGNVVTTTLSDDRVVIAWNSQSGGVTDLCARILMADGTPDGPEVTLAGGVFGQTALIATADGGFRAAWAAGDVGTETLWTQGFDTNGLGNGTAQTVAPGSGTRQTDPSLFLTDGGFGVAWANAVSDRDILLRLFDTGGTAIGPATMANSTLFGSQATPVVTRLSDGGFVMAWQSFHTDLAQVRYRLFGADGIPLGPDTAVASSVNGQRAPDIIALAAGGFALVWDESVGGDHDDAFLQVFDASGLARGAAVALHPPDSGNQSRPDITVLTDGRLAVIWRDGGDLSAQILDTRLMPQTSAAEAITDQTDTPRLMVAGNALTIEQGAELVVAHQHGVQSTDPLDTALTIDVAGTIASQSPYGGFNAIHLRGMGSVAGQQTVVRIEPTGQVWSAGGAAIVLAGGANLVTNLGLLQGVEVALRAGAGVDRVINAGTITGDVQLGAGDDQFDGRGGSVNGQILGGDGNDSFVFSHPAPKIVELAGGGIDTLTSSVSQMLAAHLDHLILSGGAAANGTGNDLANRLTGNAGKNRLDGQAGNDTLSGGAGADTLIGGAGNDRLTGGAGRDVLTGAAGRDVFVFATRTDSADTITDFHSRTDDIDLTALSGRKILFRGTADFSGHAPQVRYDMTKTGATVQVDLNGDGRADLTIKLPDVARLLAGDFLL